ncbi:YjjG family noncanonical pyrimidine nucleotidase [Bacteroidales bacterium OttesenSCG-928-K03]|nr:YjjG family noncanonical pyrimidine nucleotidase [Odoribacter sp. OttesenSCG-928-L07]MDL2238747.1 YjjG family noncanonical pyrimidine nucleotidase [Bacteroidales bacterium OttesenSCG-928-L14]MDL2242796.1 YjjG family noncanonical pyrimidine nucleotidase [Bacteroidales bacterium OttesenSCG-928-K03]
MTYSTLFFDLDNTLWDFNRNSVVALNDIHTIYRLDKYCSFEDFLPVYQKHNHIVWDLFKKNLISVEEVKSGRFLNTFEELEINSEFFDIKTLGKDYLNILACKTIIISGVKETLDQLRKSYKLHILSNGFIEVQTNKLKNCGLLYYFDKIITSDTVGFKKPDARIFEFALKETNTSKDEVIYIGDEFETDIIGANNVGIDSVWFNPDKIKAPDGEKEATFQVESFIELLEIF